MFVRMGKLFIKKSLIETLTEFAKDDYSDSEKNRPRTGSFKDFFERTSKEDTEDRRSKPSAPKEGEVNE